MFMITVLLLVNIGIMNKNASQNRELAQIAKNYAVNEKDLENTYKKIADENGYPSYKEVQDIVNEMMKDIKEETKLEAFPVGSIYLSTNSNNPSNYLGGTWESYGQGRTLVGEGTGTDSNNTAKLFNAGATGGEYTHTLTEAQLPFISGEWATPVIGLHANKGKKGHAFGTDFGTIGNSNPYGITTDGTTGTKITTGPQYGYGFKFGGNQSHNIIQPYIVTYMWKRTS